MDTNLSHGGVFCLQEWLRADYFCHPILVELPGSPTLWGLNPHAISDLVKTVPRIWRRCRGVNPFYPYFVLVDPVSRCCLGWFIFFGWNTIPTDSFLDGTVHPGCYSYHCVVTTLWYTISSWDLHTTKPQVNIPHTCKSSEFFAAEGWVVVCEPAWRTLAPAGELWSPSPVWPTVSKLKSVMNHSQRQKVMSTIVRDIHS